MKALSTAFPEIVTFLPVYSTVLLGFASCGHLLFGQSHKEWSTIADSIFVVIEINFGLYDIHSLFLEEESLISSVYILMSLLGMCVVLINVFLAIVMASWDAMTSESKQAKIREAFKLPSLSFKKLMKLVFTYRGFSQLTSLIRKAKAHAISNTGESSKHWSQVSHTLEQHEEYSKRFEEITFSRQEFFEFAFKDTNLHFTETFILQVSTWMWISEEGSSSSQRSALNMAYELAQNKEE